MSNLMRPVFPIMYNTAGNVAVVDALNGNTTRAYNAMGSGGIVTATLSGGTVASCTASGGSGYPGPSMLQGTYVSRLSLVTVNGGATPPVLAITGTSSGVLNGCEVVSGGSGLMLITVAVVPTNPCVIYPMTHIQNTWNPSTGSNGGVRYPPMR